MNRTLSQRVNASTAYPENVYQSHFGWLGGAVAIIALTFGAILPVFGGWWRLGRPVSVSPIETAKAFKAPLLREADGNGTARDIVDQVGGLQVQYGALSAAKEERGRTGPKDPMGGTSLDIQGVEEKALRRRLLFGLAKTVGIRQEGETFADNDGMFDHGVIGHGNPN